VTNSPTCAAPANGSIFARAEIAELAAIVCDAPWQLTRAHLARWRGNCLVAFGDPQTADDLNEALGAMDGTFTRAEAGLHCDLAAALHARGDRDEARRHLKRARELAQVTGSARQRRRILDLSRRIGNAA